MKTAILAGGLGTRLGKGPKSLVPVCGKPFLIRQLELLKKNGLSDVVLCVGHGAAEIYELVGDGRALGMNILHSPDGPKPLGTAGALRAAYPKLGLEPFFLLYGDSYADVDYAAVARAYKAPGALVVVLRNEGRFVPSNARLEASGLLRYDKAKPEPGMDCVDYGLAVVGVDLPLGDDADLADVYAGLSRRDLLRGFEVKNRFYEIGTPEGLKDLEAHCRA